MGGNKSYRTRTAMAICAILALGGCSSSYPVKEPLASEVQLFITGANGAPTGIQDAWYGLGEKDGDLICGKIAAPAAFRSSRSSLRFYYDHRRKYGQIELHGEWIGPAAGMMLMAQNRMLFDQMWSTSCKDFAPLRSRWFD